MVARYVSFYAGFVSRAANAHLTFSTTPEYVRSVLPPCLDVPEDPRVTIACTTFMDFKSGYPNRPGRDTAALIGVNARFAELEGSYFLTVIETEEVNVVTGREIWGMPKKIGTVDVWDDGRKFWSDVERKGHQLIEIEAEVGPEFGKQAASTSYYFELRGHFARIFRHSPTPSSSSSRCHRRRVDSESYPLHESAFSALRSIAVSKPFYSKTS